MAERIEKSVTIAAPVTRVWQALTDSKKFGEWFRVRMGGPFVAGQTVNGQIAYPGYEHLRMTIEVKAIEPQSYFSYTWHPYAIDPKVDYSRETPTLVEFRLTAIASGTLLKVTESGFDKIPAARRAEAFRMNTGGWEQQVENIKIYVEKTP